MSEPPATETRADWVRRPTTAFLWWWLPLCIGFAASFFALSPRTIALVWMVLFAWMGTGCLLNAYHCHRVHCYISGPALVLGAVTAGLFGAGVLSLGPHSLNNIVGTTLGVALLSFVPEILWRKYA